MIIISIFSVGWFINLKALSLDSTCFSGLYFSIVALRTGGDFGV